MKAVKLTAQARQQKGTGAAGRIRRKGLVPAIVYGSGKENRLIQFNAHDFDMMMKGHSGEQMLMDLEIEGGEGLKVLLKEVQHHPVSHQVIHADFNEISMTEKLRLQFPIKLVGEPQGVSQQGGVLEHILRSIEVECLPADILDHADLDVSALMIGDSLSVSAIRLDPAKYTVLSPPDQAVATVLAPKLEEEVAPEAEAAAVGEPEVLTEKKEEGEEGEEGEEKGEKKGEKKEAKGEAKKEAAKPEGKKEAAKPEGKPEGKKAK